jgi:hypothetical protein
MAFDISNGILKKLAYVTTTGSNSITPTTEHPYLLFKNPSGSGKRALIHHIHFGPDSDITKCYLRMYKTPTITTDGTALNEYSTYIAGSPPTSAMTTFKDPTISANGTLLDTVFLQAGAPSRGINRSFILEAGNNMLFTTENNVASINTFVQLFYLEGI